MRKVDAPRTARASNGSGNDTRTQRCYCTFLFPKTVQVSKPREGLFAAARPSSQCQLKHGTVLVHSELCVTRLTRWQQTHRVPAESRIFQYFILPELVMFCFDASILRTAGLSVDSPASTCVQSCRNKRFRTTQCHVTASFLVGRTPSRATVPSLRGRRVPKIHRLFGDPGSSPHQACTFRTPSDKEICF